MNKEQLQDIQNLKKYREFHALKVYLEGFCEEIESIRDLDMENVSRVTLGEEIAGRVWASRKIRELLSTLGLVDKRRNEAIDKTGE